MTFNIFFPLGKIFFEYQDKENRKSVTARYHMYLEVKCNTEENI